MEKKYKINLELVNGLQLVYNEDIASIDNVIFSIKEMSVESDATKVKLAISRKLVDNNRKSLTKFYEFIDIQDDIIKATKNIYMDFFLGSDLIPFMIKIDNTVYTTDEELANLIEEYKNALLDGSLIERAKKCNLIILDENKK